MDVVGFILQASYRIIGGRVVVHLFGRLENGDSFLVRDGRPRPHFYVPASEAEAALAAGARAVRASSKRSFSGEPVARVEVAVPADAPAVRDVLHGRGVDTFEADVRFAVRYLIDRDIRGSLRLRGRAKRGVGVDWLIDDPDLEPADLEIVPKVLAFDIETTPDAERLLAVSLYGRDSQGVLDEVLVVAPSGPLPSDASGFADERSALDAFCERVRRFDPDVLTGWNVIDFDLTVLGRIAARLRHPLALGRDSSVLRIRPARSFFGSSQAHIAGRLVLDGMDLVRGAFLRFDEYGLDAVAREVLGEGKTITAEHDRAGEILRNYREDLAAFVHYARTDARLALEIVESLNLIPLAVARSRLTGMTPDRVSASIASFDFLYLAELGKRAVVAPTLRAPVRQGSRIAQAGGEVFEPVVGMHEMVWVFDFKSLYPSLMRTFNIDPLGYREPERGGEDDIVLVNGARFSREPAILPQLLDNLFPRREAARRSGNAVAAQAIKILMNSFYGVLGTPACRFHNPDIANAITGQGRFFLEWTRDWFESRGFPVLYGDTDSVFVASSAASERAESVAARGAALARELTDELAGFIGERWRLESRLELEFEKLYTKLVLPSVRHGGAGARKRYVGLRHGASEAEFVGMEVVRRDWTELAKRVQRELYERLFAGRAVDAYLAEVVRQVRAGALDDQLVYRKGLRKPLESYVAATPPHVAAARKLGGSPPRVISYLMTVAGPEPLEALEHDPDREHYVQKQVRPVAEPVLEALGLDFPHVVGDDRQLGLF